MYVCVYKIFILKLATHTYFRSYIKKFDKVKNNPFIMQVYLTFPK